MILLLNDLETKRSNSEVRTMATSAIRKSSLRTYRKIEAGHASPSYGMVALSDRYNIWGIWGWLGGGDMPPDCEGLSPTAAIRKMAGHAAH
jgi:hypothetical protein